MFGILESEKKPAKKKIKKILHPKISYKLKAFNYDILSMDERDEVLRSFVMLLMASEKKTTMSIINRFTDIAVAGISHTYVDRSVYLTSKHDLGPNLTGGKFQHTRQDTPVEFKVAKENMQSLEMADGNWWRPYIIYNFAKNIHPAWITTLAGMCSIVNIDLEPMTPGQARRALSSHANTLSMMLSQRAKIEADEARQINDLVVNQEITMYKIGITAIVTGDSQKSLEKNCKEFERQARWRQISYLSISGKQAKMLLSGEPRFMFPSSSLAALWPFLSSELMAPDGVYLGSNELTGAPVIYDYTKMTNCNMTILGASGSGKSMTAKTYISNFLEMAKSRYGDIQIMAYILDLHGEYVDLSEHLNMDVVDLIGGESLGLDPFILLEASDRAADLLCDVVNMPPNLKSLVISKSEGVTTVHQMVDKLHNDTTDDSADCRSAATYLAQFTSGELAKKFTGDMKIGDKAVIALRKAAHTNINSMLITLTLLKIWQDMRNTSVHIPKLLVIEEAWFALRMESTASILSDIARSGRKENVHMLLMTQDIDEVLDSEHGAAVIKNSSTILMLKLSPASAERVRKVLELSESEKQEISSLDKGQAIMRADSNRIKLRVRPSAEQLKMFDTSVNTIGGN